MVTKLVRATECECECKSTLNINGNTHNFVYFFPLEIPPVLQITGILGIPDHLMLLRLTALS